MENLDRVNRFEAHRIIKGTPSKLPALGTWICIPTQYAPGQLHEVEGGQIVLTMVSLAEPVALRGHVPKRFILRLVRNSVAEMVAELEKRFGTNISYSVKNTEASAVDTARSAEAARRESLAVEREQSAEIEANRAAWRELCLTKSPEELQALWHGTALEMMQSSDIAGEFAYAHDFFQWPLDAEGKPSNWNWQQLVAACHGMGVPQGTCPALDEMIEAYQLCKTRSHFKAKSYKRSEAYLRDAVTPYDADEDRLFVTTEMIAQAKSALARKYGLGANITEEKAEAIGISTELFQAILAEMNAPLSANIHDLKRDVVAQRPARSRVDQLRTY
jgi:hypothetical protein